MRKYSSFSAFLQASQAVLVVKKPACQCRRYEIQVQSLGQEDSLEEGMATHSSILQPTPVFLLGESHGQRSLGVGWGIQPIGSQTVEHDRSNLTHTHECSRRVSRGMA